MYLVPYHGFHGEDGCMVHLPTNHVHVFHNVGKKQHFAGLFFVKDRYLQLVERKLLL